MFALAPREDGAIGGDGEAVLPPAATQRRRAGQQRPRSSWAAAGSLLVAVAQLTPEISSAPAPDGAVGGDGEAVAASSRHSDDALASQGLDLLGQQLVLLVAVAQLAKGSMPQLQTLPSAVMARLCTGSSRHSDDALVSKASTFLGSSWRLLVAVAQLAKVPPIAPAPDGAVGGEGEAVAASSRHSDDALPSQGLDLLGQQLVLLVAVAQPAMASIAPAPDGAVGGEGEAVEAPADTATTRCPARPRSSSAATAPPVAVAQLAPELHGPSSKRRRRR